MSTFLFNEIIFGPVNSRRLGVSLGINLLPVDSKLCNFNCIYCECGWNDNIKNKKIPSQADVFTNLKNKLKEFKSNNKRIDVITFAGNGEPTLHPQFSEIIDDTIKLRNDYMPNAKITVLSNATRINIQKNFEALQKVDNNILKLDSGIEQTIIKLNQPNFKFKLNELISYLKHFEGKLIIQTLFAKITENDLNVDNTTDKEISAWLNILKVINPSIVMIYTISRDTPKENMEKISLEKLSEIAQKVEKLGIKTQVSV